MLENRTMDDDDWGLYAIVRSCNKITTAVESHAAVDVLPSSSSSTFHNPGFKNPFHLQTEKPLLFPDPLPESINLRNVEDLQDLLIKPIFPKFQPLLYPNNIPISPLSVIGGLQDLSPPPPPPPQPPQQHQHVAEQRQGIHPTPKSKKRKNQQKKKVCHVPAEGLSSDMWSWRKYGQKPIKGSPYPRGYYRCSTSKSCSARKQVERNRSDPSMFILTYTGEHSHAMPTHRNSLAGSTRQKPDTDSGSNKPSCSSPVSSAASLSPAADQKMEEEEEEDGFGADGIISDDFFEGLEDITGMMAGKPSSSDGATFLWPTNNVTSSAAGRG